MRRQQQTKKHIVSPEKRMGVYKKAYANGYHLFTRVGIRLLNTVSVCNYYDHTSHYLSYNTVQFSTVRPTYNYDWVSKK